MCAHNERKSDGLFSTQPFLLIQFVLLHADIVLSYFRCFSAHFRYAKSNLLVSRRAAVGAHPR